MNNIDKIKAMAQIGLCPSWLYEAMLEPATAAECIARSLGYDTTESGIHQCLDDLSIASRGESHAKHQTRLIIQSVAREGIHLWLANNEVEHRRDHYFAYGRKFTVRGFLEIAGTDGNYRTVSPMEMLGWLNSIRKDSTCTAL